jgi:phage terminase small subunit
MRRWDEAEEAGQTGLLYIKMPNAPSYLDAEAKREWSRMGHLLIEAGRLTAHSTTALAAYASAWGRHVEAELNLGGPSNKCPACWDLVKGKDIQGSSCEAYSHLECKFGKVLKNRLGGVSSSPWVAQNKGALVEVRMYLAEFGMTPATAGKLPRPQLPARPTNHTNGNGGQPAAPAKDPRAILHPEVAVPDPPAAKKKPAKKKATKGVKT